MCLSLTRVSISGSDCSPEPLSSYEDPSSSINICDLRTYTFEFMAGDDGGEVLELLAEKLPALSLRHDVIVGVRRKLRGTAAVDLLSVVDGYRDFRGRQLSDNGRKKEVELTRGVGANPPQPKKAHNTVKNRGSNTRNVSKVKNTTANQNNQFSILSDLHDHAGPPASRTNPANNNSNSGPTSGAKGKSPMPSPTPQIPAHSPQPTATAAQPAASCPSSSGSGFRGGRSSANRGRGGGRGRGLPGANEKKLSIWRELDEADRRIFVINQGFHTMPSGSIPNPTQSIIAARRDQFSVWTEMHGGDGVRVRRQHLEALPALHIPNSDRLVKGAGNKQVGLMVVVEAEDVVGVAGEGFDKASSSNVPYAGGFVVGGGGDIPGVGGEGEVGEALLMPFELVEKGAFRYGPNPGGLVRRGGAKEAAIVGELNRRNGAFVAFKGFLELVGLERLH
nr:hypothetical protein LR48_Vigan01g308000 [Ipomoea batatas]